MAHEARRPVYVLGSGGLAREMAQLLRQLGRGEAFGGFIAEEAGDVGKDLGLGRVVGDDAWLLDREGPAEIVVGIGYPAARAAAIARYLGDPRFVFPNLVHPTAMLEVEHVRLGRGNVVTAGCVFTVDIEVGDFNLFNWTVTVGHDARIGDSCVINPGAHVSGWVSIGDRVLVGTGASILEGRAVGTDARVGAGAVVTHDVPDGVTVVGVPAREVPATQ
ncbi:MAG TPA: NeuD/PglB/VioB family sugar acetyltransferase [Patescibacteria group bacterium]|nr:NeuD/PglB/VioB family sugar acetyltransferase [Patescibacteria group bacterium]